MVYSDKPFFPRLLVALILFFESEDSLSLPPAGISPSLGCRTVQSIPLLIPLPELTSDILEARDKECLGGSLLDSSISSSTVSSSCVNEHEYSYRLDQALSWKGPRDLPSLSANALLFAAGGC